MSDFSLRKLQDSLYQIDVKEIPEVEVSNISDIFQEVKQDFQQNYKENLSQESISLSINKIRLLFLSEKQYRESLSQSLKIKTDELTSFQATSDKLLLDKLQIKDSFEKQSKRISDLEELCRNLQNLSREKENKKNLSIEQEKEKTKLLQDECIQSIESVTQKILSEENDLKTKSQENLDLNNHLEQFMKHLQIRNEKISNEKKTKELSKKIKEVKEAQARYYLEQEIGKLTKLKEAVLLVESNITQTISQMKIYQTKFSEFEETLNRSNEVLEKASERENLLNSIFLKLLEENELLKKKAAESDVNVIVTLENIPKFETEISQMKSTYEKLEKKCRKLLLKRKDMLSSLNKHVNETELKIEKDQIYRNNSPSLEDRPSIPSDDRKFGTPTRQMKSPLFASSSSSSPSRVIGQINELAGDGSPVSSPKMLDRKP